MLARDWLGITKGVNVKNPPAPLYTFWSNWFTDLGRLGVGTGRDQCNWSLIETSQGVYDWSYYDDVVAHYNASGLKLCLTLRGAPPWALTNVSQQATDEPYYLPDATLMAGFASVLAARYNGTAGHGYVDYIGFNEDFNIHTTPTGQQTALNQTITSGQTYSTLSVTPLTTGISAGVTCLFGTQSGKGQRFTVSVAASIGATSLTITDTSGNPFVASANQSTGQRVSVLYFGLRANTNFPGLYDGTNGVKSTTKPQPARDARFFSPVFKAVQAAIKAVHPACKVGTASIWWKQGANPGGVPNTPFSNHFAFTWQLLADGCAPDWIDVHYYSAAIDPSIGNNQTNAFAQVLTDIQAALAAWSSPAHVWVTEFGWSATSFTTTSSTQITTPGQWTIDVASAQGIRATSTLLIDANTVNVETVTILNQSNTSLTCNFVNTHSGTYSVQVINDCDPATEAARYAYVLNTARVSGVVDKLFFFTLDYKTSGFSPDSLVQFNYNNDNQYGYLPAFTTIQSFAQQYPSWSALSAVPDQILTSHRMDRWTREVRELSSGRVPGGWH